MDYKEKLRHITKMGISSGEVVNERVPLVANKVLKKYDSETTAVIYIFGEKILVQLELRVESIECY